MRRPGESDRINHPREQRFEMPPAAANVELGGTGPLTG
jgi:hypothetical protein